MLFARSIASFRSLWTARRKRECESGWPAILSTSGGYTGTAWRSLASAKRRYALNSRATKSVSMCRWKVQAKTSDTLAQSSRPPNKPDLDSARKLNLARDRIGAEVPAAVVPPASLGGALGPGQ